MEIGLSCNVPELRKPMAKGKLLRKLRATWPLPIQFVFEDRREDALKAASADALSEVVTIEK
jgi:hypothetical protein